MQPKKTSKADLTSKTFLFFNVGLVVALLLSIFAFTFKVSDDRVRIDLDTSRAFIDPGIDIPITVIPPQQPPLQQPRIEEVDDDEPVDEKPADWDLETNPTEKTEPLTFVSPPEVVIDPEDPEEIFTFLQESATPEGGLQAFYQFVGRKVKYPRPASRMGIEGRVYVEFIVEKDGSLSNIRAITEIGGGCEEEAERVVAMAPKWNPGKQRGKPVRQKIILPINFTLK
jgi:protein TonB